MSWEALKKSINGLINKVNVSNIVNIIQELLQENIVRGRYLVTHTFGIYKVLMISDSNVLFHVKFSVVLMSYLTICLSVRGLLARSVLQAQAASPIFTHVYAAVVAIINSKFPQIGELILKRLILTFRRSYRRNLKVVPTCLQL